MRAVHAVAEYLDDFLVFGVAQYKFVVPAERVCPSSSTALCRATKQAVRGIVGVNTDMNDTLPLLHLTHLHRTESHHSKADNV